MPLMDINEIKRKVYAMRNGVAADVLRRGGSPYRMIFGVNLPHLSEIAQEIGPSANIAEQLWADHGVRESLILATMVYPPEQMTRDMAVLWLSQAPSVEIIDVLCHRLIHRLPFARDLADALIHDDNDMMRYAALRIYFNLLPQFKHEVRIVAETEFKRNTVATVNIASSLIDELNYIDGK